MKRFDMRIVLGLVLVVAGSMFLLQSLGLFHGGADLLWATILGGAGVAALYVYANNRANWWALIPGTTLVAIAFNIIISVISPRASDMFGGGIVLGGIAVSFWLIFLTQRGYWWAVIPAGVLSSVALVTVADEIIPSGDTGGLFLIGLGLTFFLVANLPGYENELKWAYIPGGILTLIGVLLLPFMDMIFNIIFPLALIGAGGYVLYKNYKK